MINTNSRSGIAGEKAEQGLLFVKTCGLIPRSLVLEDNSGYLITLNLNSQQSQGNHNSL